MSGALVLVVAVCAAAFYGATAAPTTAEDNSPCRSPVTPYQIVDCGVILQLAEILDQARSQERARAQAQQLGSFPEIQEEARMEQRAQAHAEQIGGGGSSSTSSSTSSTSKCFMTSYPYDEIPCDQVVVQSTKDKRVMREYSELMKRLGKF